MDVIDVALHAVAQLDDTRRGNYIDVLLHAVDEITRSAVEALMGTNWEYKSEFAKTYFAQGKQAGREEGREEGREAGREEEARRLLLAILADRKLGPSDAARARVEACADCATLERWVVRAASAASEDDVFAAS